MIGGRSGPADAWAEHQGCPGIGQADDDVFSSAMKRATVVMAAIFLLTGCDARTTSTASAKAHPEVAGPGASVTPTVIAQLTDQTLVYHCPECGMDYDRPGQCSMEHADLVPVRIDYLCPLDHQPVAHAGQCPRCAAPATIERTTLTLALPSRGLTGN